MQKVYTDRNRSEAKIRIKIKKIEVKGLAIITFEKNIFDFISLTDIAKYRDSERTNYIIQNWMRTRSTVEFLGCGKNYIT